jgi:hypothetical protein
MVLWVLTLCSLLNGYWPLISTQKKLKMALSHDKLGAFTTLRIFLPGNLSSLRSYSCHVCPSLNKPLL